MISDINQREQTIMTTWIAAAYDSDHGFALGATPEDAQAAYASKFGEPTYGFSVIRNREEYRRELARVGVAMGYIEQESIPLFRTGEWIVVERLADGAEAALEGKTRASHMLRDWTRDDGEVFIRAPAPVTPCKSPAEVRAARQAELEKRSRLDEVEGLAPSDRQREWAARSVGWQDEMAWADKRGELMLTVGEIRYVQAVYRAKGVVQILMNPVYRSSGP